MVEKGCEIEMSEKTSQGDSKRGPVPSKNLKSVGGTGLRGKVGNTLGYFK